jgi:glycosyltransferase involved in cell wall biosynthesis
MNTGQARISIVVACRNEIRHIREFLDSILSQDLAGMDWEVIVADGMSEDGTREVLEQYAASDPRLRVVSNPGRTVSTGLNAAIVAARGDIVLRMDAHTMYAPDYSRRCVETLQATGAENVGGPARTRPSGTLGRAVAAAYHSPISTGGGKFHDIHYEGLVDTLPYGCWRKETLVRIGLFDEALVRNQDDELNLRICRAGGRVWQDPQIVSWYVPRSKLSGLFRQYFQYGFWKVAVIRKHRLPASWRHLVPAAFVLANAFLASAAGVSAAAAWPWWRAAGSAWGLMLAAYLALLAVASVDAARRHGWRTLPYLPLVFATYHLSFGLGFLAGMVHFLKGTGPRPVSMTSVYSRLTR